MDSPFGRGPEHCRMGMPGRFHVIKENEHNKVMDVSIKTREHGRKNASK